VRLENDNIWLTLNQIAGLFERDKSVISRHLKSVYGEGELTEKATVAKNATVQIEGDRKIERVIEYYNLDAVISVGYRVNSKRATQFRIWATRVLREHITKGYTINPSTIKNNYQEFLAAVDKVKALLPAGMKPDAESILELIKVFADTWLSLDAYDKENYQTTKITKKKITLTAHDLLVAIAELKKSLIKKGEATEIFASERNRGSIEGVIGNVMQSFGGKDVYLSVEEKAAHLLYFMIKNHPFIDGNKRSGAFAFVWFLQRNKLLNISRLSPVALTALTLLIAESNPKDKDKMTGLVVMLLKKK